MSVSQNFPTIDPSLVLNFQNSKTLDPRITFTRGSIGTYVDVNGLIRTASADQARFDHDPATGESLGLLIEGGRTNLHLYSEQISSWSTETGGSVTANAQISPDGNLTADVLTGTGYGSSAYLITSLLNATTYTFSIFLKYIDGNENIEIQIGDAPFARSITRVNSQTGTLVYSSGGAAIVHPIKNYGNGWYRYSITRTTTAAGGGFIDINHVSSTISNVAVWGAQIENGEFPTSYIPTTSSQITRVSDSASVGGTNFANFYNPTEGTYIINYKRDYRGSSIHYPGLLYSYSLLVFGTGDVEGELVKNQNVNAQVSIGIASSTEFKKMAVMYNDYSYGGCLAGGPVIIGSGGFHPSLDTSISFGTIQAPTAHTIKSLIYYPERLTNTQLQTLTK